MTKRGYRAALLLFCLLHASAPVEGHARPSDSWQDLPWRMGKVVAMETLHVGRSEIEVGFGAGAFDLKRSVILDWVTKAAEAVSAFYGAFPVARTGVLIVPVAGEEGIVQGTTWGEPRAFTRIRLGQHTTQADLLGDWEMTHEFVHLAFPSVSDQHHWIEEGLATYIEPLARAQIGLIPPPAVWNDMMRDMPKGEPAAGDRGLDNTHTWGRTYWGGAMFCLLADVEIRERTGNQKGLKDALRAIASQGGTIEADWPLRRAFEAGDKATGTSVLVDLYRELGNQSKVVDLDALWARLGVRRGSAGVVFDDDAPLAAIRQQMIPGPAK